ncbi:hypothetical protein AB6M99_10670 [Streptococcus hillyeri]|uniref:hypothetical protein n=1 Tax=Streptococcus hillyeri TaxID=2282420 RepID=UPI0034E19B1E
MKKQLTMLTVLATVIALGAYWGLSTLQISASETAVVQEAPQVAPMKTTDALVEVWKDRPIEELESYLAHIPNEVPVIAYPDEVGGESAQCARDSIGMENQLESYEQKMEVWCIQI